MRLLEVVRGAATAPDALATGLAVARRLRKLPVVTGNAFGFIGNRIYAAYRRQCEFMIEEGAWPEQVASDVDVVLVNGFGFPRWEGGPVFWARERGAEALAKDMDWLAGLSGPGFVRGDLRQVLQQQA